MTLKTQLSLFLLLFLLLLAFQLVFTRTSQLELVDTFSSYQIAADEEKLVRELERDVLDLQRHVLVFKDTGSVSSKLRFDAIITDVKDSLVFLVNNLPEGLSNAEIESRITAMEGHLNDYQENFNIVVSGRESRDSFFEKGVLQALNSLIKSAEIRLSSQPALQQQQFSYHLSLAENKAYQYVLTPNSELKTEFSNELAQSLEILMEMTIDDGSKADIQTTLQSIENQFTQLTLTTTGYLYLVNVVMAGSANEFLFLAQELSEITKTYADAQKASISRSIDDSRSRLNLYSLIGISVSLLLGFFIIARIIRPISKITRVFEKLSEGKDITDIPGGQRKDEIGQLVKAAKVFNTKNMQTESLLMEAQTSHQEAKNLNEQLQEAIDQAQRANASKSIFLANMSHEIRTPMNAIIGLVDLSMREDINKTVENNLSKILYSSQILTNVINDILDFSKIEAGKLEIEDSYFSFASLLDTLLAVASLKASEKNLNLHLYVDPELPTNAIGDPLRISQVALNLLSNAIKFTRKGSVDLSLRFECFDDSSKFKLILSVTDTGIGMTEKQLERIFSPFMQADGSTSREFGGTGLGLTIVQQLVKLMDGDVKVSSVLGEGSTFECSFVLKHESSPQFLLDQNNEFNSHIHYLKAGDKAFVCEKYLNRISDSLAFATHEHLSALAEQVTNDGIIIIDIENGRQARALHADVQKLKAKNVKYACVTNTQPEQLKVMLSAQWECPVLAHPFTPTQFYSFVSHLYNNTVPFTAPSHDIERENPSVNIISTKLYEGHVLLVEDNSINQAVAGEMLHSFGLTYDIAEDGQQAITKVNNSPYYDLILMDIQMPVMDGNQATKEIRQLGFTDFPIIGLSANAMKDDYKAAKQSGMDDYLTKPIRRETLREAIEKYLKVKTNSH